MIFMKYKTIQTASEILLRDSLYEKKKKIEMEKDKSRGD